MKTTVLLAILSLITALMMTSCNTLRGAGRDVEKVGSAVSNL